MLHQYPALEAVMVLLLLPRQVELDLILIYGMLLQAAKQIAQQSIWPQEVTQ